MVKSKWNDSKTPNSKPTQLKTRQRKEGKNTSVTGDEHEPSDNVNYNVHVDAQASKDNDVEIEPAIDLDNPQSKNQCYDKRDFVARKHGREREPWVQKPMPFLLNHPTQRMMRILSALLK